MKKSLTPGEERLTIAFTRKDWAMAGIVADKQSIPLFVVLS
jgi:hypothetical protein